MMPATFISYDAIGLVGVVMYIIAYAALQLGWLRGSGYAYTVLNLVAAILVLVSLTNNFNLSSAIIQITWIVISIFGLTRMFILYSTTRLNAEETAFIKSKFPSLSKPVARSFLNAGLWINTDADTVVATEGQPIGSLIYLGEGNASVDLNGKVVASLAPDTFIGELTCFDGEPATATVTVNNQSRFFQISTEALNRLCERNPDLKVALENAIGQDTRTKLVAANARISGNEISASI